MIFSFLLSVFRLHFQLFLFSFNLRSGTTTTPHDTWEIGPNILSLSPSSFLFIMISTLDR